MLPTRLSAICIHEQLTHLPTGKGRGKTIKHIQKCQYLFFLFTPFITAGTRGRQTLSQVLGQKHFQSCFLPCRGCCSRCKQQPLSSEIRFLTCWGTQNRTKSPFTEVEKNLAWNSRWDFYISVQPFFLNRQLRGAFRFQAPHKTSHSNFNIPHLSYLGLQTPLTSYKS